MAGKREEEKEGEKSGEDAVSSDGKELGFDLVL